MDFCKLVLKHIVMIIVFALVFGVLLGGYAKVKQSTTYSARRQLVISHNIEKVNARDKNSVVLADMQMLNTYAKVADDQSVYNKAKKILASKYSIKMNDKGIAKAVQISPVPQTLVMNVTASGKSASKAVKIANATGVAVKDELPKLVNNAGNIKLLSSAETSDLKSTTGPSVKKYGALGVAAGLFVGLIVVFARYTITDPDESKNK